MLTRGVRLIFYILTSLFLSLLLLQSNLYQAPQDSSTLHVTKNNKYSLPTAQKRRLIQKQQEEIKNLPSSVVKSVQRFLFFIGYALSGHNIMANLLDAHPHIVISHEYSVFSKWVKEPQHHADKAWLFNALLMNSWMHRMKGLRTKGSKNKGYTLSISGGWQGKYKRHIDIFGDKAGGMTTQLYRKHQSLFINTYQEMKKNLKIPINVIHVIRNPYDNIATMFLHNAIPKANSSTTDKYYNNTGLREYILNYFKQVQTVTNMIKNIPLNVIRVHVEDLISNPKYTMRSVCSFLHVECTSSYLQLCANSLYSSEFHSRELVHWTRDNIELVHKSIKAFGFLQRYTFTGS